MPDEAYRQSQLEWPLTQDQFAALNDEIENIYRELRRLTVGTSHKLLSATHTDTTEADETDGDLIVGQGGTWRRKAKGANGQMLGMVTGAPEWTNDGSGLQDLNAAELVGTIPTASMLHNVLSAAHADSTPASPVAGDVIVAQQSGDIDQQKYWLDGAPLPEIGTVRTFNQQDYWGDGGAAGSVSDPVETKWARKAIGAAGSVLVSAGNDVNWQDLSSLTPVYASFYRVSDVAIASSSSMDVALDGIVADTDSFAYSDNRFLEVPTGKAGVYLAIGQVSFASPFFGSGWVAIVKNGVTVAEHALEGADGISERVAINCSWLGALVAGDLISVNAGFLSPTGTASTIKGGSNRTFLQLLKV